MGKGSMAKAVPRTAKPVRSRDSSVGMPTPTRSTRADVGRKGPATTTTDARGAPNYTKHSKESQPGAKPSGAATGDAAQGDGAGGAGKERKAGGATRARGASGAGGAGVVEMKAEDGRDPYEANLQDVIAKALFEMPAEVAIPPSEPVTMIPLPAPVAPRVEWNVPSMLPGDALKFPVVPKTPDSKPGDPGPEADAATAARQGYGAFAIEAAHAQRDFLREAAETAVAMGQRYRDMAGEALQTLQSSLRNLEFAREQALVAVDRNGDAADGALEIAYRNAVAATLASSHHAHARIEANFRSADAQINDILDDLVEGHNEKYQQAKQHEEKWHRLATKHIEVWSEVRAAHYPTIFRGLDAAKNEERQRVIPDLVEREKRDLNDHSKQVIDSWEFSRATTEHNIRCAYRCPLDKHKEAIHTQGRAQVTSTLEVSLQTLRTQTREGRAALAAARIGARGQVEAQARVGKEKLYGEARAAIAGAQRETQVAQRGVQSASESTSPAYARLVQRFEDAIRRASLRGALAVSQVVRTMPGDMARSLQGLRSTNFDRLLANGQRLERSLVQRRTNAERGSLKQTGDAERELNRAVFETGSQLAKSADDFSIGFDQFAQQITFAADAWAKPFETTFAEMIEKAEVSLEEQVTALMTGAGGEKESGGAEGGKATSTPPAPGSDTAGDAKPKAEEPECAPCSEPAPKQDARVVAREKAAADLEKKDPHPAVKGAPGGKPSEAADTGTSGAKKSERPKGLQGQMDAEAAFFTERCSPRQFFKPVLENTDKQIRQQLETRMRTAASCFTNGGFWDPVNDTGICNELRGITALQGSAIEELWDEIPGQPFGFRAALRFYQCPFGIENDDFRAAISYLDGKLEEGVAYELKASIGFFNDDEARIENVMGSLDKSTLANLERDHAGTLNYIEGYLGGTDLAVYNALRRGDYAVANSLRMEEEVNDARKKDDLDAADSALATRTRTTTYTGWTRQLEKQQFADEMAARDKAFATGDDVKPVASQEERIRASTVGAMAERLKERDILAPLQLPGQKPLSPEDRVSQYVTRPIDLQLPFGHGKAHVVPLRYEGAHRDFADATIRGGPNSIDARAARYGIELERSANGKEPRPDKLLEAARDPRFVRITPEMPRAERLHHIRQMEEARAEREAFIRRAGSRYGGMGVQVPVEVTQMALGLQLSQGMDDNLGANFVRGIVTEERMSPTTAAWGMRFAMESHRGTDEDLLYNIAEHMDRGELEATRLEFRRITVSDMFPLGRSLDAALGIYGEEDFEGGELSGDDRLRMERAMMGQPRNDLERFEVSMFALQQQKRETGGLGSSLAGGSFAERSLLQAEAKLLESVGGHAYFDRRGRLMQGFGNARSSFDATGKYQGNRREDFMVYMGIAPMVAQQYSAYIDSIANAFAMMVAVLGAIAAAVITVVTLGAGTPLLVGAVKALMITAAVTGGLQMGLAYAIKGGRYGWEQALLDLGMTAVSVATAGIGAGLGNAAKIAQSTIAAARAAGTSVAAARAGLTTLQRVFTGSPVVNQIMIGSVTGAVQGFGTTALDPETWKGGAGDIVGNLIGGTTRGLAGGAAQGGVSAVLENVKLPFMRMPLGERMQHMGVLNRGLTKGTISSISGMAGRSAELGVDRMRGKYRGDWGDALGEIGDAGRHAFFQGMGEGMGEAKAQRWVDARNRGHAAARAAKVEEESRRPLTDAEEQARARALVGEPVEAAALPLLAAETAGLPPQAGRAMPELQSPSVARAQLGPEGPDAPTRRGPSGGDDEDGFDPATPRRAGDAEDFEAAQPFGKGTAAAVDENFRGDVEKPGTSTAANVQALRDAVRRLLHPRMGEFRDVASLPQRRDALQIELDTPNGRVRVRVQLSDGPLPPVNGSTPVARFDATGTGEYTITVSGGASRRHMQRALAHELAEIRAGHGGVAGKDVLRPDGAVPFDADGQPRLSPHDEGRIAEIRVVARQLRNSRDPNERELLRRDLVGLASHLGLGNGNGFATDRSRIVLAALREGVSAGTSRERAVAATAARGTMRDTLDERRLMIGPNGEFANLPGPAATALARRPGENFDRIRLPRGEASAMRRQARADLEENLQEVLESGTARDLNTAHTRSLMTPDEIVYTMETGQLPPGYEAHHIQPIADFPERGRDQGNIVGLPHIDHVRGAHDDVVGKPVDGGTLGRRHPNEGTALDRESLPGHRRTGDAISRPAPNSSADFRDLARASRDTARWYESRAESIAAQVAGLRSRRSAAQARGDIDVYAEMLDAIPPLLREAAHLRRYAADARIHAENLDARAAQAGNVTDNEAPLPAGTAAAVRGSAFRGDAEGRPRPLTQVLDEAAVAVTRLTTAGAMLDDAVGVRQPDGSIVVLLPPPGGVGKDVEVRIVARDSLEPTADGVPVARFRPDPGNPDGYLVEMSARAPAGTARRALAHELTEIRHAHAGRISHDDAANLLRAGGFGAEGRAAGPPALTPHDRGRLAEVRVLGEEIAAARIANDDKAVTRLEDETQRLLAHLGLIDESPGARARLELAQSAMADDVGRQFLQAQAEAARAHPFLRAFPEDSHGRQDLLIKRLKHARAMGDAALEASVFRQAQALLDFSKGGNVVVRGSGPQMVLSRAWLAKTLESQSHPLSSLLAEMADYAYQRRLYYGSTEGGRMAVDPAADHPDLVAATDRRFRDYQGRQTWEEFQRQFFGMSKTPKVAALNRAFYLWVSGRVAFSKGKSRRLVDPRGLAMVRADVGRRSQVPEAALARSHAMTETEPGVARNVGDAIDARRAAMAESAALQAQLRNVRDPDEYAAVQQQINDLIPRINNPTRDLGEAAAARVARERFGGNQDNMSEFSVSGRPDLAVDSRNPDRLVVIEAKGADATLGYRLSRDGTRRVQQGTFEYLDSLAAEMMRPGNPPDVIALGRRIDSALRTGQPPIEYYVVRQPIPASGDLPPPQLSPFILRKP
jgi:hypothetical protein